MTFIYLSIAILISIVIFLLYINHQELKRIKTLIMVGLKADIKGQDLFEVAVQVWRTEKKIKEHFNKVESVPEAIQAALERQKRWLGNKGVEIKDYTSMPAHGRNLNVANIDYDKKTEKAYISEMIEPEILYYGKIVVQGKVKVIYPRERKTFKVYLEGLANQTEPTIIEVKEDTLLSQETLNKYLTTREGYDFESWYDKTTKKQAENSLNIQSDTYLVAQWKQSESPVNLPVLETTIQYFFDKTSNETIQTIIIRANEEHAVIPYPTSDKEPLFLGWFQGDMNEKIVSIKADGNTHLLYPKFKESNGNEVEEIISPKESSNPPGVEEKEENQNESKN